MATDYSDPSGNGTNQWAYGSYTNVDDGTRQPTTPTVSPTTTELVWESDNTVIAVCEWTFSIAAAFRTVTEVTAWRYKHASNQGTPTWTDEFAGALGAADSTGNVGSWDYATWTGLSIDLAAGVSGKMSASLAAVGKGDNGAEYGGLYFEYEYTAYTPGSGSAGSPFLLFVE